MDKLRTDDRIKEEVGLTVLNLSILYIDLSAIVIREGALCNRKLAKI